MKALIIAAQILLGGIWLFYATIAPSAARTGAISDAMALENELAGWALGKVVEGKLTSSDIQEIFSEDYALRLGGESPKKNFHEMIEDIAGLSAPPIWPGIILIVIGGVLSVLLPSTPTRKRMAEQAAPSDGEKPPN
jgi:hypothetical protein